jgi:O-acetyl-ADP-ribose deacetylase (regulator of RNase III)
MSLIFTRGDIWQSGAQGIVVPVNCVGVPGAGLALQAQLRYPIQMEKYVRDCARGRFRPGSVYSYTKPDNALFTAENPLIICAATKDHWSDRSHLDDIRACLLGVAHTANIDRNFIPTIAIPALGCGLGGLDWERVKPLVKDTYERWNRMEQTILVYEPPVYDAIEPFKPFRKATKKG